MTGIVGGTRNRVIQDNFYLFVQQGLTDLSWFQTGLVSAEFPVTMISREIFDEEIRPNSIAVSSGQIDPTDYEMGSDLTQFSHSFFIDIYGENEDISKWIAGDILAFVRGNMKSLSVYGPTIPIYELPIATTPTLLFNINVEGARQDPLGRFSSSKFKFHWYQLTIRVTDYYADEVYQ